MQVIKVFKKRKQKLEPRKSTNSIDPNSRVFSYHSKRTTNDIERSSRTDLFDQHTQHTNRNLKYVPTYLALIVIVLSLFYVTVLDVGNPQIVSLAKTTPSVLHDSSSYQKGISEIMGRSIFNKSKLSINTSGLSRELLQQYPELESATIVTPLFGKRPIIRLTPARPVLIMGADNGQYVIGSNGKVLSKLSDLTNDQTHDLLKITDLVSPNLQPGQTVLPSATIDFISALQEHFNGKGITIKDIELPAVANELHLYLEGSVAYIKFNLQDDVNQQAGTYLALIENVNSQHKPLPTEYVDVRVDGRVYYK